MKLIDILNRISEGTLNFGTQFRYKGDIYVYKRSCILSKENSSLIQIFGYESLNEEIEIIEPTENATEKIKELDNYDWQEGDYDYQIDIIYRKLNEVIRRINNE